MKLEEGLRQRPMAPEMVEEFVAAYSEEVNRHRREATAARAGKERALAEVRRKLDKLIEALIEGYRTAGLQQKLEELEARKAALEQELTADPPPPVRLHPNLAQVYRGKVGGCTRRWPMPGCATRRSASCAGCSSAWRSTRARTGCRVEIVGAIVTMVELGLDAKQAALPVEAAGSVKVVAGAGFEPATFRL